MFGVLCRRLLAGFVCLALFGSIAQIVNLAMKAADARSHPTITSSTSEQDFQRYVCFVRFRVVASTVLVVIAILTFYMSMRFAFIITIITTIIVPAFCGRYHGRDIQRSGVRIALQQLKIVRLAFVAGGGGTGTLCSCSPASSSAEPAGLSLLGRRRLGGMDVCCVCVLNVLCFGKKETITPTKHMRLIHLKRGAFHMVADSAVCMACRLHLC